MSSSGLTVEEYIQFELESDKRHEFVNGQLIEVPAERDINNEVAGAISIFLLLQLKPKGFQIYAKDVKVSTIGNTKFYYPDVFATKEKRTEQNHYIKYEPELIVEVISPTTLITDRVDKYIAYTTIPSLKYYLIVEPETIYVTIYIQKMQKENGKRCLMFVRQMF